jgi:hypothetical protein
MRFSSYKALMEELGFFSVGKYRKFYKQVSQKMKVVLRVSA